MILNSPENRHSINEYLESVNEDEFTISIVDQLKRAYGTPFSLRSGGGHARPHYAILVNARRHSNDADKELNDLLSEDPHFKILSQENVCELIIKSGVAPRPLLDQLSTDIPSALTPEDRLVYDALVTGTPADANACLDNQLGLIESRISQDTKELVIEYIHQRWMQDKSWDGTVSPMRWFNRFFGFISENQLPYLIPILEEYCSTNPSFAARSDTTAIVGKIGTSHLLPIAEEFIRFCAERTLSMVPRNMGTLVVKITELLESEQVADPTLTEAMEAIVSANTERLQGLTPFSEPMRQLHGFVHGPNEPTGPEE